MTGIVDWQKIRELTSGDRRPESPEKADETWSKFAPMYDFMSSLERRYTLAQVDEMILDKTDSVLDIGCGIGRLTVPVAKRVAKVTALDVAGGMLEYCTQNVRAAGLTNVRAKKLDWKNAVIGKDIETHDVAFASRSVGLNDILKLNQVANKYAFLLSFARYPSLRHVSLELLQGLKEDAPDPAESAAEDWRSLGYNVTFNILYDLGLDPMVHVIEDGFERTYPNREDAYQDLAFLTREVVPEGALEPEQWEIFKKNVDLYLTPTNGGDYQFKRTTQTYVMGWETRDL